MSHFGDVLNEAEKNIFETTNKIIKNVYVDLQYLQDFRFGALCDMVNVPAQVFYIQSCLQQYNNRYFSQTASYFPILKKTDKELDEYIHDPKNHDRICFVSPFTSVYYNLIELLCMYRKHNQLAAEHPEKINVLINSSDIEYPQPLADLLCKTISNECDANVRLINDQRYTLPIQDYVNFDILMLYEYGKFFRTFSKQIITEDKFNMKQFICFPYIQKELNYKKIQYDQSLSSTEKGLNLYCDFLYLKSEIPIDKIKE